MRIVNTATIAAPVMAFGLALGLGLIACDDPKPAMPPMAKPAEVAPVAAVAPAAPVAEEVTGAPGSVKITVAFEGQAPKMAPMDRKSDPFCAKTKMDDESVTVNKNKTLKNVAVRLADKVKGDFAVPTTPTTIIQEKCMYRPRLTTAMIGQQVEIKNTDTTLHNVHAYKGETEQNWFNSAQPPNSPALTKPLGDDGVIHLKCDVHPWMSGWVVLSGHPFHGVTGDDGSVTLANVPSRAKAYKIKTWHEKYGAKEVEVMVEPGKTAEVKVTYSAADQQG